MSGNKTDMSLQSSLSTGIDLQVDLDEEQDSDEYILLACLLVGAYLSEKMERPTYYVRNRMVWERRIAKLTAEGNDVFNC